MTKRHPHIIAFEEFVETMQKVAHTPTVSQEYFRKYGLTKILRYSKVFFYDRRYTTSLIFCEQDYRDQHALYARFLNRLFSFINFSAQIRYILAEYVYSFEMRLKAILSDLLLDADLHRSQLAKPIDWTFGHLLKMVWNLKIEHFVGVMFELFGLDIHQEVNGKPLPTTWPEMASFAFVLFYFTTGINILRNNLSHNDLIYDFKRNKSMGRVFSYMKECYHWTTKDDKLNDDLWSRYISGKKERIDVNQNFFKRTPEEKENFLKYAKNFGLVKRYLHDYFHLNFREQNQGKFLSYLRIFDTFFFKDNRLLIFNKQVISPDFVLFSNELIAHGFSHSLQIRLEDLFLNLYQHFKDDLFGPAFLWREDDFEIVKNMDAVFGVNESVPKFHSDVGKNGRT